jgi:uncharacterized phiE125 gp8 family phage protein
MSLALKTGLLIEPVSLTEAKLHLRIDSTSFAEDLTSVQSIAPGGHVVAAAYSLKGTGVDVLGYSALVLFESGTNASGGTVNIKIQESDTDEDAEYTDFTGGSFTQVTTSNDNATFEKAYTGTKQYIRVVATVAVAACEFSVSVIKDAPTSAEDTLLEALITTAREYCEGYQNRQYITATWELWLDRWPCGGGVKIPRPPLQIVNSIKYYGTDNTEYTMEVADYFVDSKSEPGRVSLAYGITWPTITLRPINGVCIEFDAGYGDAVGDVPKRVKQSMLLLIGHWYGQREAVSLGTGTISKEIEFAVHALLGLDRLVPV